MPEPRLRKDGPIEAPPPETIIKGGYDKKKRPYGEP